MSEMIVQRINKTYTDEIALGIKYYSIISELNNLKLTTRELELLAFTAQRGTISSLSAKEEFNRRFHSSTATVNNMISKLSRMGLLVKVNNKSKVNPKIALDFSKGAIIQLVMFNKGGQDAQAS